MLACESHETRKPRSAGLVLPVSATIQHSSTCKSLEFWRHVQYTHAHAHAAIDSVICRYYSFEIGPAHIVILSSETDFLPLSFQYQWLLKDLALVNRTVTPWLLVSFHKPFYNSNTKDQLSGEVMRLTFEKIFFNARVDVVVTGHVHAFERVAPVYDGQLNDSGPVYVIVGNGGTPSGFVISPFCLCLI